MLIDESYFKRDLYISDVGENTSSVVSSRPDFATYINQYEREILIMAMGVRLYTEFRANIVTTPGDPNYGTLVPGADQKWDDLLNGAVYGNKTWRGLVMTIEPDTKLSLMAFYVYYKYWQERYRQTTTLGFVNPKAENGATSPPAISMENAWRGLYEWYGNGRKCTCNDDWIYAWYAPGRYKHTPEYKREYVDLYTFLQDNKAAYSGWSFTPIKNKNRLGL